MQRGWSFDFAVSLSLHFYSLRWALLGLAAALVSRSLSLALTSLATPDGLANDDEVLFVVVDDDDDGKENKK